MYKPTEKEKNNCIHVIKEILNVDNVPEEYIDTILNTTYAIGGDFSPKTLKAIAEVVLKDIKK